MKLTNSLGFLFIGAVMYLLPHIVPSLSPVDIYGHSTRGTWLEIMGGLQIAIGLSVVVRKAGGEAAAWLERWPELVNPPVAPDFDPIPQAGVPTTPLAPAPEVFGEMIPVEFKPAWSEQRAA